MTTSNKRFRVALSFPGERREFVKLVAEHLTRSIEQKKVLYDKYHEPEFARIGLDVYLPNLYRTHSDLIAVFLCREFQEKRWCGLEWRYIRDLIETPEQRRIILLNFDDIGPIPDMGILAGDGQVSIGTRAPNEIAALILERLALNDDAPQGSTSIRPNDRAPRVDLSRLPRGADRLFGRDDQLAVLDQAWESLATTVVTIVAWGGQGKTSLVVEWAARKAVTQWAGFDRVFAWSFYRQGTGANATSSSDQCIAKALEFFGDATMAVGSDLPWDKGARLAQLVGAGRNLLILDGVEPLQESDGATQGELNDPALQTLLKSLSLSNRGLCVVTSRFSVYDLGPFSNSTVREITLDALSDEAGAKLLHSLGANRCGPASIPPDDEQLIAAAQEVRGHALTLYLLGTYIAKVHNGDLRRRDRIDFQRADETVLGGHAFRVLAAYEEWFAKGDANARRALAILRLMGLFDRPADAGCIAALCKEPTIKELTETLVGIEEENWNLAVSILSDCGLIAKSGSEGIGRRASLDAHPLIRNYLATEMREKHNPSWRSAHQRLFGYLVSATIDGPSPSLADLQPLYQAVTHACEAQLHQKALIEVFRDRIRRGKQAYSLFKLGAFASDLAAVASFFDKRWGRPSEVLSPELQGFLLGEASFDLAALGRLEEAVGPSQQSVKVAVTIPKWKQAAIRSSNLAELRATLGDLETARGDAEQAVNFAEASGDAFHRSTQRATLGWIQFQTGDRPQALRTFGKAEEIQAARQPQAPRLYALQGFEYCEVLLTRAERAAWRRVLMRENGTSSSVWEQDCVLVRSRAEQVIGWRLPDDSQHSVALEHLALGRACFLLILHSPSGLRKEDTVRNAREEVEAAAVGLRRASMNQYTPHGLLTRAWIRSFEGLKDASRADLDEAWSIAQRGPMRLHMADIHLYRARLFYKVTPYPWTSPRNDLAAARDLIKQCGYQRRDEELADAEGAIQ